MVNTGTLTITKFIKLIVLFTIINLIVFFLSIMFSQIFY